MDIEHQEVPTWLGAGGEPASRSLDIAGPATDSVAVMPDGTAGIKVVEATDNGFTQRGEQ